LERVLVKELLETLGYLIVLNHALAYVLSDDLLNYLTKFGFKMINTIACAFYALLYLLPKIFNELCFAIEVLFLEILLFNLSFQLNDVPPVGFLRDSLVKLEYALAHVFVFSGVLP